MAESRPPRNVLVPLNPAIRGEKPAGRRIYLMRNAESCDRLCQAWRHRAFKDHGVYRMMDLNQPVKIVSRPPDAFKNDAPVTQVGSLSAQLIGRGMALKQCGIHTVFCSPALRCIQTALAVTESLNMKTAPRVVVEPGLMDPLSFYWQDRIPNYLKMAEIEAVGYPIDTAYQAAYTLQQMNDKLFTEKTTLDVKLRLVKVCQEIAAASKDKPDGGVLVVTHAPIIDLLMRQILDEKEYPKSAFDLNRMGLFYPFCSVTTMEQDVQTHQWKLALDALPKLSYVHMTTAVQIPTFD